MELVIPPKRPLSFDILVYLVGFLWQSSDIEMLNTIRLASRKINQLVEGQVVFAHNDVAFDTHRRLAKLCAVVLRRPAALLPFLRSVNIRYIHEDWNEFDDEREVWVWHPCICTSLLADVLERSRSLERINIMNAEQVIAGNARLSKAISASPVLRYLEIWNGIGPCTMAMLRRMTAGVCELELTALDNDLWSVGTVPFVGYIRGLSTSLEKLTMNSVNQALDIGTGRPDFVWPKVRTIELEGVHAVLPDLCHAFPNLRNLWLWNEVYVQPETDRAASRATGRCWPSLDDVNLSDTALCALGLTCRIRRLTIASQLESDALASFIVEDLPAMQPLVLRLSLHMAPSLGLPATVLQTYKRGVISSVAGHLLQDLPRLKALKLRIDGQAATQTIEGVDKYIARPSLSTPTVC
jgi:hypothetical protein